MFGRLQTKLSDFHQNPEQSCSAVNSRKCYFSLRNFFELVRFDFVLDDKMKVWLMEVSLFAYYHFSFRHDSVTVLIKPYCTLVYDQFGEIWLQVRVQNSRRQF